MMLKESKVYIFPICNVQIGIGRDAVSLMNAAQDIFQLAEGSDTVFL
jgi:hypothetical protein